MPNTQPAPGPAPSWSITYQRETTQQAPQGGFVQGVIVGFHTSHGVDQSVFIPYDKYTPDYVRQAIAARVSMIDAVHNLSG